MMKIKYILILTVLLGFMQTSTAQDTVKCEHLVDSIFSKTGEVYFTFTITSKDELHKLTKIISIDHYSGDFAKDKQIHAYANKKQFYKFLKLGYQYKILPPPGSLINPTMLDEYDLKKNGKNRLVNAYPTYPAYEQLMYQFEAKYPDLCKVVNIKTLASGRKLLLLKITDNINSKEDEPQFLYTSTMHGDETAGYPLMLSLIEYLLSNYKNDVRVAYLVNNIEIWINPLANPDGTYKGGNNTVSGATRSNANNIDLNRNYPDPKGGQHPDGEVWQAETKAFMAFADTMNIVMAANFHGGAEVVNYPWDTWAKAPADKNWWIEQSKKYADTAQAQSQGKSYMDDLYSGNNPGVTQGFPWYEVEGGRQDYMNYFKHCREVTIELSAVKVLAESNLDKHWQYNYRSLLSYMEECLHGIRGITTDACTGRPIRAKVFINSHDVDSTHVYSNLPLGNYHRPVYAGTYDIEFSANGYETRIIKNIVVSTGGINLQHIALKPTNPLKPTITQLNGTLYSSSLVGNQWYVDYVAIIGATSNSHTPWKTGSYVVKNNHCTSVPSDPVDVIINGVHQLDQKDISIYPNPGDGRFVISTKGLELHQMQIQVLDVLGKLVWEEKGNLGNTPFPVNLNNIAEGVYYLKIFSKENYYTTKFFLQK